MVTVSKHKPRQDDRDRTRQEEIERERIRQEEALDEALKNTFPRPIRCQWSGRSSKRLQKSDGGARRLLIPV